MENSKLEFHVSKHSVFRNLTWFLRLDEFIRITIEVKNFALDFRCKIVMGKKLLTVFYVKNNKDKKKNNAISTSFVKQIWG